MSIPRVFRNVPRADGLLGGIASIAGIGGDDGKNDAGFLSIGDPLTNLPGFGGITSALSLPLPSPGPGSSSSDTTTTNTGTISLTSDTATSATATTSDTTSTSATSATSDTSSLTSDTQTATNTQPPATNSPTQTLTQQSQTSAPTSPPSQDSATLPPTSATSSSSSGSASATAVGDNAPKGFLQNKALSVGVITAASLVGLVLLIALATWAIRKRRKDRLHQDILDFSTANLVSDAEKGGGGAGAADSRSRRQMFADAGDNGSISGHGSGSSSGHGTAAYSQPPSPAVAGHPAASRAVNPYSQPAYADRSYAFPSQEQNNTYANWGYGGYGNNAATAPAAQPQNAYDQAYGGYDDAYGGIDSAAMAGVGAGAQSQGPQRRPSAHRKPPPQLYIPPANPIAQAVANTQSPESTVSLTKPPLQPASGMGAAQPARRMSLLNSPPAGSTESGSEPKRERRDTLTHVELLDPAAPKAPTSSPPLPDEFGTVPASKDRPAEEPVRRLVVRNE
ncbi:hypothetical protein ONZ51_g11048 [Trametes cubensis]|uniref:Uncharacterized protein n=1 Tax=Trametes cubensis TaxID=1111947 RepID=A0AAD7TKY0_9APHY|nr:hypothetical protein ONZ51_g11048 [Trametes cubensis]